MTTQAAIGYGVDVAIKWGSPEDWVSLGEITNTVPPTTTRDAVDATHTGSQDKYREFIPGLIDAGEATVDLNYVPGGATAVMLREAQEADDPVPVKISFPNGASVEFKAIITELSPEAPIEDKMTLSVTFKITGKPVWTDV